MLAMLRYDCPMKQVVWVSVVVLATVAVSFAQGVPASVTSTGFGGHFDRAPGIPASVTSIGTIAPRHPVGTPPCCFGPLFPTGRNPGRVGHRHHHNGGFGNGGFGNGALGYGGVGGSVIYYPVPYEQAVAADEQVDMNGPVDDEEEAASGPTIYDRRGQTAPPLNARPQESAQEAPKAKDAPARPAQSPASVGSPVVDSPKTVLVFKDGHQLEVANFAIVGDTLWDLTPGHSRRVALSELDLPATVKENDNRGVDFRLPPTVRGG